MDKRLKYLKAVGLLKLALEGLTILKQISEIKKERKRSCCVKEVNRDRKRNGFFEQTFLKLRDIDHEQFFIYTRMSPEIYKELLHLVTPFLQKNSLREPLKPECRLAVTLVYLTQGNTLQSIACSFKLGKETVRSIILETTNVIWSELSSIYIAEPSTEDYKKVADDFWNMWDMPNCIGSIDGKHIRVQSPSHNSNPLLRKRDSIVLLAACDARYRFTHIDVGDYGSQSDGGIFQLSRLGERLLNNKLPIPPPKNLPNTQIKMPYYFVGGSAFPLGINLMRPFPGEQLSNEKDNFNKRLSRGQRTIENAFGILVSHWRVLLTTLHLTPENAEKIILACVVLHNFIMLNDMETYIPENYADWEDFNGDVQAGSWRTDVGINIPSISASCNKHRYGGKSSTVIRNNLCNFYRQL